MKKDFESRCDFGHVSSKNPALLRKMMQLALRNAGGGFEDNREALIGEFETVIKGSGINADEEKLLRMEFLQVINTPFDELERRYLETIFELEDEDKMARHLADFIENGKI